MKIVEKLKTKVFSKDFTYRYSSAILSYVVLIVIILISCTLDKNFFTARNLKNILYTACPLMLVAFGQTLVVMTAGIDLSLGAIISVTNVICASFMAEGVFGWAPAVGITLLVGVICGAVNGFLVAYVNLPAIIVTLASSTVFEGVALLVMSAPGGSVNRIFGKFMSERFGILTFGFVIVLIIFICLSIAMHGTFLGSAVRAVGENESSAYSAGIKTKKIKMLVYIIAGVLSAIAGIYVATKMYSGDPTIGANYTNNSVTAAVIGGTFLSGAVGDLSGTLAGAIIITLLDNILNLVGVSIFWKFVLQGAVLILALTLGSIQRIRRQ